jgi:hypothetical protein
LLIYLDWGGRGLMEVPRMLLAARGKFPPGDYTDMRCTEPASDLEANLGIFYIYILISILSSF